MQIIDRDDTHAVQYADGLVVYYNPAEVREFDTLANVHHYLGEDMLIPELEALRVRYCQKFYQKYKDARLHRQM